MTTGSVIIRLTAFLKNYFGEKIYKVSLDGGFQCPNRDGTLGTGGCIFCSEGENMEISLLHPAYL